MDIPEPLTLVSFMRLETLPSRWMPGTCHNPIGSQGCLWMGLRSQDPSPGTFIYVHTPFEGFCVTFPCPSVLVLVLPVLTSGLDRLVRRSLAEKVVWSS